MSRQIQLLPLIIVAMLGTAFGLVWAYVIAPPVFTGGNPHRLNQASQEQWILMVAVASSPSIQYNAQAAADLISRVPHPLETIYEMQQSPTMSSSDQIALQNLLSILPLELSQTSAPTTPGLFTQVMMLLIPMVIVAVIGLIMAIVFRLIAR
jgi:hypothetical protein